MKLTFSKAFIKSSLRLSGKMKSSLQKALQEIEKAKSIDEISDCKKLKDFEEVSDEIKAKISQVKQGNVYNEALKNLREKYKH